jgi:hypothetical protein
MKSKNATALNLERTLICIFNRAMVQLTSTTSAGRTQEC